MQHLFGFGSSLHAQRKEEEVRGQRSINQSVVRGSGMHTHAHITQTLSLCLFSLRERVRESPRESTCVYWLNLRWNTVKSIIIATLHENEP